jgi:hypothetical protein
MRGALAALALFLLAAAPVRAVDLAGTWYVLVHYKDDHAENADAERWEDRVWVFERLGNRLEWTDYPIVVFEDESGRFERRDTGQYARILHYWEPNEVQLADIRDGLQVNSRGSKSKSLRGSDAKGWSSVRRAAASSASVVTYQEVWSIDDVQGLPVFTRSDFLGGGRTDTLEGVTKFTTTRVENGVLLGTYDRDGSRRGDFRMLPSGTPGALKGAPTQEALQKKVIERQMDQALARAAQHPESAEPAEAELVGHKDGAEDLEALRASGRLPTLPRKGMRLEEVVAALRAPASGDQKATLLRKLEVLRLRPDGFDLIPADEVLSGSLRAREGESYGVLALAQCSSRNVRSEFTSWYLVSGGELRAWDHYERLDQCVYTNLFQPATGDLVPLEQVITAHRDRTFPHAQQADAFFYAKGVALALVGRVDDAKRMLALGDENLTSGADGSKTEHTALRSKLVTRSTDAASRERLVRAIEVAEQAGAASKPASGP